MLHANYLSHIKSLVLFINKPSGSSLNIWTCFCREAELQKLGYVHYFGVGNVFKLLPICLHFFFPGCINFLASSSGNTVINEATRVCAFICNVNVTASVSPRATASVKVGTHCLPLLLALHSLYGHAERGKVR